MYENLIRAIGSPDFARVLFKTFHADLGARMAVVMRFSGVRPAELLLTESRGSGRWMRTILDMYYSGYYQDDPLQRVLAAPGGKGVFAFGLDDITNDLYRQKLYREPGLSGKLVLVMDTFCGPTTFSLYRDCRDGPFQAEEVQSIRDRSELLSAVIDRHSAIIDSRFNPSVEKIGALLQDLDASVSLSSREAEICARTVLGYSSEAVALDLGLSRHSVSTYRRRAYQKLGISSQNELFALILKCGGFHLVRSQRRNQPRQSADQLHAG